MHASDDGDHDDDDDGDVDDEDDGVHLKRSDSTNASG